MCNPENREKIKEDVGAKQEKIGSKECLVQDQIWLLPDLLVSRGLLLEYF